MVLKKPFVLLFTLTLLESFPASSQALKTARCEFTRTITRESASETTKGTIFYQAPKTIVLKITQPLTQWMVLDDKAMLIYYPAERKALRFKGTNPLHLPFSQTFVGVIEGDLGLEKGGFMLTQNEVKNGILITHWRPPKDMNKVLGNVIIGFEGDKLSFFEVKDPRGQKLIKTIYRKHLQYGTTSFPMEVITVYYQRNGSVVERISYSNPRLNVELPDDVVNFKIPMDTEINEIKW